MKYRVGFDLKGEKRHHAVDVTNPEGKKFSNIHKEIEWARQEVLLAYQGERIERALLLVDCIELAKRMPTPGVS